MGGTSRLLITTRNLDIFNAATPLFEMPPLDAQHAAALLVRAACLTGDVAAAHADIVQSVAAWCRGLPLALCILGALVEGDPAALRKLGSSRLELRMLDARETQLNVRYAHSSLASCLGLSLSCLPPKSAEHLLDLAVYREVHATHRPHAPAPCTTTH
eukprot:3322904-Prymnesium_polylepis.1